MQIDAQPPRRVRRAGFTLIEMVVVITILVILAGMVIAKLDVFDMKANKAVAATSMADIARFVQMYRVNTSQYPDGWDTLLTDPTSASLPVAGAPNTGNWGLHPELTGGVPFNGPPVAEQQLTTLALNPNHIGSLGRLFITRGFYFNTVSGGTFPNYQPVHPFAVGDFVATLNPSDPGQKAQGIIGHIYPQTGIPADVDLIVFGLGPNNTMVGSQGQQSLLFEAPFYPNQNQTQYYNRYLCVFEVNKTAAKRPRLVAVLGADGDPISDEIADFSEN